MKRYIIAILIICTYSCSENEGNEVSAQENSIAIAIENEIKILKLDSNIKLSKWIYLNNDSEEKIVVKPNWEKEFAPFKKYNLNKIAKQEGMLIDTVYDERTKRYLLRGNKIIDKPGVAQFYLMMDSNRRVIQLQVVQKTKNWFNNKEAMLFWDKIGKEYSFKEVTEKRFGSNINLEIIGSWGKE